MNASAIYYLGSRYGPSAFDSKGQGDVKYEKN